MGANNNTTTFDYDAFGRVIATLSFRRCRTVHVKVDFLIR